MGDPRTFASIENALLMTWGAVHVLWAVTRATDLFTGTSRDVVGLPIYLGQPAQIGTEVVISLIFGVLLLLAATHRLPAIGTAVIGVLELGHVTWMLGGWMGFAPFTFIGVVSEEVTAGVFVVNVAVVVVLFSRADLSR